MRWRAAIVGAMLGSCASIDDPPDDDADDESTGTIELPTPGFLEPASGRLDIPIYRTRDVVLAVTGVVPGITRVRIDASIGGTWDADDPRGTLTADALTLRLRGAMVVGTHALQLVNESADEPLGSNPIEVRLDRDDAPTLLAELDDPVLAGSIVATAGAGPTATLMIYDDSDPAAPRLQLVPHGDDGWDVADAREVTIAGYRRLPFERSLAIAVDRTGVGPDDRVRIAWRVGDPGSRIDLLDLAWADADPSRTGARAFDLDPAVLGAYEHAQLGRPVLLGDTIVAEVLATTDVEAPQPGARALLVGRLTGTPVAVTGIARVELGTLVDLDAIAPVLDARRLDVGARPLLSARVDQRRPIVLAVSETHGRLQAQPSIDDPSVLALRLIDGPLHTLGGAFGSRTVVALDRWGFPRVVYIDDSRGGRWIEAEIETEGVPEQIPSGAIAVAQLAGAPVMLLPFGPDGVRAWAGSAMQTLSELVCDHVAIAFDPRAEDVASIACASASGVALGRLFVQNER